MTRSTFALSNRRRPATPKVKSNCELLGAFLTHIKTERGLSRCTEITYRYQLEGYLGFLADQKRVISQSTKQTILEFLTKRKENNLKPSSLFNLTLAVRQFHRFLCAESSLPSDPTANLKLPKFEQKISEPLSIIEEEKLLKPPCSNKFVIVRTQSAIECAYDLGLRVRSWFI